MRSEKSTRCEAQIWRRHVLSIEPIKIELSSVVLPTLHKVARDFEGEAAVLNLKTRARNGLNDMWHRSIECSTSSRALMSWSTTCSAKRRSIARDAHAR